MKFSKIKKLSVILLGMVVVFSASSSLCMASALQTAQNKIGTDKVAHFGVGFITNEVLQKTTKTTALERFAIVSGLAIVKESTDTTWDNHDILATCLGSVSANLLHGKF